MGGSAISLLHTVEGLRKTYGVEPTLLLVRPSKELLSLYQSHGIEVHPWKGISTYEHTTAAWGGLHNLRTVWAILLSLIRWRTTYRRTLDAVRAFKPDLVYLNSVVLLPCAAALHLAGVKTVVLS